MWKWVHTPNWPYPRSAHTQHPSSRLHASLPAYHLRYSLVKSGNHRMLLCIFKLCPDQQAPAPLPALDGTPVSNWDSTVVLQAWVCTDRHQQYPPWHQDQCCPGIPVNSQDKAKATNLSLASCGCYSVLLGEIEPGEHTSAGTVRHPGQPELVSRIPASPHLL